MAEKREGVQETAGEPVKGILKKSKGKKKAVSMVAPNSPGQSQNTGVVQWDEMNILMTEHPEGKEYGHMKIEEPKTPYYKNTEDSGEEGQVEGGEFSDNLAQKVQAVAEGGRRSDWDAESSGSEIESEDLLSEEERERKRKFKEWRKKHYNEFYAVKRARELINRELSADALNTSSDSMDAEEPAKEEGQSP